MSKNPFALPNGEPIPGKYGEWWRWRDENWKEYLATLSEDEREVLLRRKRAISRRMASEAGTLSPEEEVMAYVEYLERINPYSRTSGWPMEGKLTEWAVWNRQQWNSHLLSIADTNHLFKKMEGQVFERWQLNKFRPVNKNIE
jgi:hypothetical protein